MQRSDNIRSFIFGPWVGQLRDTFADIDRVRREGGFNFSYRDPSLRATRADIDRFLERLKHPDTE